MGQLADNLKRYFAETPQDVLDREWDELKYLNEIGPDVLAYAERVRSFYSQLMNTRSGIVNSHNESFMSEDLYYLAA